MMEDHQFGDDGGGAGSDIDDDADSDVGQEDGERRSSFDIHDMKSSGLNLSKELLASEYGLESNSDSSDDKDEPSLSTIEAANAAKASIIKYYNNLFSSIYEREQRYGPRVRGGARPEPSRMKFSNASVHELMQTTALRAKDGSNRIRRQGEGGTKEKVGSY